MVSSTWDRSGALAGRARGGLAAAGCRPRGGLLGSDGWQARVGSAVEGQPCFPGNTPEESSCVPQVTSTLGLSQSLHFGGLRGPGTSLCRSHWASPREPLTKPRRPRRARRRDLQEGGSRVSQQVAPARVGGRDAARLPTEAPPLGAGAGSPRDGHVIDLTYRAVSGSRENPAESPGR